jgi:hypothetical protein
MGLGLGLLATAPVRLLRVNIFSLPGPTGWPPGPTVLACGLSLCFFLFEEMCLSFELLQHPFECVPFFFLEKNEHLIALFAWFISHQPAVLFSHNKPATSNHPAVLFSQNKPAPAITHQPTEQAGCMLFAIFLIFIPSSDLSFSLYLPLFYSK